MIKIKVLVISFDFYKTHIALADSFTKLGCSVVTLLTYASLNKEDYFLRIKHKLGFSIEDNLNIKRSYLEKQVKSVFDSFKPDLVYVVPGRQLLSSTIEYMKTSALVVAGFADTLSKYPIYHSVMHNYDLIYSYELEDVILLNNNGINAKLMSGLANDSVFYPMNIEKDIDICFVGTMYPLRRRILEKLADDFCNYNLAFFGTYAKRIHPMRLIKLKYCRNMRAFTNSNIDICQVNELYNRSKICLNINCEQTKSGWSSRLTDILSSGQFQIVDTNSQIETTFGGGIVTFSNYQQLKDLLYFYLKNNGQREIIARKGHSIVLSKYTIQHGVSQILKDIKELNNKITNIHLSTS